MVRIEAVWCFDLAHHTQAITRHIQLARNIWTRLFDFSNIRDGFII
jgi:hypothetical protein